MKIELKEITIRELSNGYEDNAEEGVVGYGGKLDIRPPYQREFIYKDKQRDLVIDTVTKNFPLNVMYWSVREDGNYEVIDGQQRTISICQYIIGDFSVKIGSFPEQRAFHNLQKDEQEKILNYQLSVYLCTGTDIEKLEWFKTINIAGEELTDQELRNAVFHGPWVSDAKRHFSKSNCPAYGLGKDYLSGAVIRQDFLETAIKWISKDGNIDKYMSENQNEPNANELWLYFQSVINWVKVVFPKYRKEMKGNPWGELYNEFNKKKYDSSKLENQIEQLMMDDDVTNKKGIYSYILTNDERHLSIRTFTDSQKRAAYEKQKGICPLCKGDNKKKKWEYDEMEGDHITPWSEGGKTSPENLQMLCKDCNRRKGKK